MKVYVREVRRLKRPAGTGEPIFPCTPGAAVRLLKNGTFFWSM